MANRLDHESPSGKGALGSQLKLSAKTKVAGAVATDNLAWLSHASPNLTKVAKTASKLAGRANAARPCY